MLAIANVLVNGGSMLIARLALTVAAAAAAAVATTGMEAVEEEGGARGRERKAGSGTG